MRKTFAFMIVYALLATCAYADVEINAANFPDEKFRTLVTQFDSNNDGTLSDADIAGVTRISASRNGIKSLKGIENFTALKTLYCDYDELETLDLSGNTNLETLFCIGNKLTSIELTNCNKLKELYCYENELTDLNVADKPYLVSLDCQVNKLSNLDLTKNYMLEFLDCSENNLTALNVSENTELNRLYCHGLNISNGILDVSKNTKLTHLWCWDDKLTEIKFPENVTLRSFIADDNDLSNIDPLYSLVSNPLELSVKGNSKITTSTHLIALSDFALDGNTAVLDIGNYENISKDSIKGYDSSLNEIDFVEFVSGDNNGIKFSSAPEMIEYDYYTGISTLRMTAIAYRSGSTIKNSMATTFSGVTIGSYHDGVISWKGIPYAKAPTGTRRWKAPEALDRDTRTIINAEDFAPAALQLDDDITQSENCLYLNIWKADNQDSSLKPVVVWVHGGSFKNGTTADPIFSGQNFVAENNDIIFVSVGYRLGIMGLLDLSSVSGGENYPDSNNLMLLDILQALRWLKINIASFGGDPNNITLMGQSSGSACISFLLAIPESQNLFQRAILESGAVSMSTRKSDTRELTRRLLEQTGKTNMAGLMSLSESELRDAIKALDAYTIFPQPDGRILSEDLYAAFEARSGNFDILTGTTADELNYWKIFMTPESYDQFTMYSFMATEYSISQYSPADAAQMESYMTLVSGDYAEFFNDLLFRGPAIRQAESHSGKTYMYYWDYPIQSLEGIGACHTAELAYFLNNEAMTNPLVPFPNANVMSKVQSAVASFIRTGNPSTSSFTWPEYNATSRQTVLFGDDGAMSTLSAPLDTQRELIEPLLKWGVSGREMTNGNLDEGISIDPNAAPKPDPKPDPDPDPDPDPNPEKNTVGRSGGGCNAGLSIVSVLALFMLRRKK